MIIRSIELNNFRNYESLNIEFDNNINILYGDNAQGKTNLLEACYYTAISRSYKGSKDKDIVKFDKDFANIKSIIEKNDREYEINIQIKKSKKKIITIDKVNIRKSSELLGLLNVILFSPEDLNIIKNGPSERRRFIDSELCQIDSIYLSDISNYNKLLNNRNKLLKDISIDKSLKDTLDVWDMQLIKYGKKIIKRRREFIDELKLYVKDKHLAITGGKEELIINYEPNIDDIFFEDELIKKRDNDLRYCQTSVGPHRDDISFKIDGIDMRKFGSQGQQRCCALSLKLSEIDIVSNIIKEKPVLLLDDVLSELDSNRQKLLLDSIEDIQTIITCTGLDDFVNNRFDVNKIFKVVNGNISEIKDM